MLKAYIALEDGTVYEGESFGAPGEKIGEVVFNTSLVGYQEVLTDPSYTSQIVTMTYPLIGNYGVNEADMESDHIQVAGFIVKEACPYPSNFTSVKSLGAYLAENGIIGVSGIDTRALTRKIRITGALKGVIFAGEKVNTDDLVDKARSWQGMTGLDLAKVVTCKKPYQFERTGEQDIHLQKYHVIVYDFGVKTNQLRILRKLGCKVTVIPGTTPAAEALGYNPDGIFLSNGPGDPDAVTYAIEAVRELVGKKPLFGICLGHQILGLALGGRRFKLKFGHRGANHPVKNLVNGRIEITSQNHGFCIDAKSVEKTHTKMTHVNLNDDTCEGIEDTFLNVFSVQYHPEAAPGPHDSGYLFDKFAGMMKKNK